MNDRETVLKLRREVDDLTAKLAAAMGALAAQWAEEPRRWGSTGSGPSDFGTHVIATGVHAYCSACGARTEPGATMAQWAKIPHKSTCPWKIAQDALADEPPGSKRYRAIKEAAEAETEAEEEHLHSGAMAGVRGVAFDSGRADGLLDGAREARRKAVRGEGE